MKITRCKTCNAEIIFLKTTSGKFIPIDYNDNIRLDAEYYDSKLHVSHFATCKQASEHRKTSISKTALTDSELAEVIKSLFIKHKLTFELHNELEQFKIHMLAVDLLELYQIKKKDETPF